MINDSDNSDFYRHYFESGLFNKSLSGIVQVGARAHGLLNVSNEDFFNLEISQPSSKEQAKIATVLNEIENQIQIYEIQLKKIKVQKQGLMQKLLTGQIRVKVEA